MASVAFVLCSLLSIFINFETCFVHHNKHYPPPHVNDHKALFVFGDSLFDPGNDVYVKTTQKLASLYWPYGETFFHHATGRFSDGRLVPDFIATFAGLPMLPPYLEPEIPHVYTNGANFASAGSRTLLSKSPLYIDLPIQVNYFKLVVELLKEQVGEDEGKRILANAVYLFSSGGNDYFNFYSKHPDADEESMRAFVKLVTRQLHESLLEITSFGGKKIAFQNVGIIGCNPGCRLTDGQCNEKENFMAREHNKALIQVMEQLEREIRGFKYSIFDYYTAMKDRIFNPKKYGFEEGQVACCGLGAFRAQFMCGGYGVYPFEVCKNPSMYVWFDEAHTTEEANLQLSRLIWEGGSLNITYPYTVHQLFQL